LDAAGFVEHRLAQAQVAEATAALPVHRRADAALFTGDDFFQPRQAVGFGVVAHFDADPPAAHLVGHGGGGAAADEAVEDEIAGVGGDVQCQRDQLFRLGCRKRFDLWKQLAQMVALCRLIRPGFFCGPPGSRHNALLHVSEIALDDWIAIAVFAEIRAASGNGCIECGPGKTPEVARRRNHHSS
jgi:hypothetical protein